MSFPDETTGPESCTHPRQLWQQDGDGNRFCSQCGWPESQTVWRCTYHKRDNAAETAGEYPTGACWGALRNPGPGMPLGCVYERQDGRG